MPIFGTKSLAALICKTVGCDHADDNFELKSTCHPGAGFKVLFGTKLSCLALVCAHTESAKGGKTKECGRPVLHLELARVTTADAMVKQLESAPIAIERTKPRKTAGLVRAQPGKAKGPQRVGRGHRTKRR